MMVHTVLVLAHIISFNLLHAFEWVVLAIPKYQYISGNCDTETKQPIDADCKVPATML